MGKWYRATGLQYPKWCDLLKGYCLHIVVLEKRRENLRSNTHLELYIPVSKATIIHEY